MKSINEKSNEVFDDPFKRECFETGANYVLEEIETELLRRMLVDYNQGVEEDEVAQSCMASMIMFVRQLKK